MAHLSLEDILKKSVTKTWKNYRYFWKLILLQFLMLFVAALIFVPFVAFIENLVLVFVGVALFLLVILVSMTYFHIAMTRVVVRKKWNFKLTEILKEASRYFWRQLGLYFIIFSVILSSVVIFGLLLLFQNIPLMVIAGIVFVIMYFIIGVYWLFANWALLNDRANPVGSIKYSYRMVKGRFWTVFGYHFVYSAIVVILVLFVLTAISAVAGVTVLFTGGDLSQLVSNETYDVLDGASSLTQLLIAPFSYAFLQMFFIALEKDAKKRKVKLKD